MKKLIAILTIAISMVSLIDARGGHGGGHRGGGHSWHGGHGHGGRWGGRGWGGGWGWGGAGLATGALIGAAAASGGGDTYVVQPSYPVAYPAGVVDYTGYPYYSTYIATYPGPFNINQYRVWLGQRYPAQFRAFFGTGY